MIISLSASFHLAKSIANIKQKYCTSSSVSVFIDVDKLLIAFYWFHKYVINKGMTRSRYVVEENTWVAYLFLGRSMIEDSPKTRGKNTI